MPSAVAIREAGPSRSASTPWCTHFTYRDVIEFVGAPGTVSTSLVLPKVHSAAHVGWLDLLLTQIGTTLRFEEDEPWISRRRVPGSSAVSSIVRSLLAVAS